MSISNFNPHGCSLGFYQSPANKKKHTVPNCEDSYDDCILRKFTLKSNSYVKMCMKSI